METTTRPKRPHKVPGWLEQDYSVVKADDVSTSVRSVDQTQWAHRAIKRTRTDETGATLLHPTLKMAGRGDAWSEVPLFLSRVSVESVDSRQNESGKSKAELPAMGFQAVALISTSRAAEEEPAKVVDCSWSSCSEDTAEASPRGAYSYRPSKRFRQYCADNPYAAQAATASLLAGAAWIDAVQALAAATKVARISEGKKSSGRHNL